MSLPDILFKGVPRRFTRGYTAQAIREFSPDRVFIPCVGAYALAWTATEAGVDPSKIEACDISLYSSVIGAMLAGDGLDVQPTPEFEWLRQYMGDAVGKVAAVSFAIRLCQYQSKKQNRFIEWRIRELTERADVYIEQARKGAERLKARLGGMRYKPEDMWDLLGRAMALPQEEQDRTMILCNPPRYTGGYEKMYAGIDRVFTWPEPSVQQFDESQYRRLVDYLSGGPRTLVYYATPVKTGEDPADEWGSPWTSVFAARPKTGTTAAINWIVANRNDKALFQRSDVEMRAAPKYKLFREGQITAESELRVVREKAEIVNYYRDLLVHRLGMVSAERYQVLLLDGKLLACLGFHVANLRTSGGGKDRVANLTFAFSPQHPGYPRLHKLTLMSVVSSWLWAEEMSDIEELPQAIQTTMLTPFPEVKTARGIFELKSREREKDGQFKLKYYADLVHRTPQETVRAFLERWG